MEATTQDPKAWLERMADAANQHDLDALADCFAEDYLSEIPAHPQRTFQGREQVRKNWSQIFAAVPDIRVRVLDSATRGQTVWAEWEFSGTRRDGAPHRLRGVTIVQVEAGRATHARFYMEPVDEAGAAIDSAVRDQVAPRRGAQP